MVVGDAVVVVVVVAVVDVVAALEFLVVNFGEQIKGSALSSR